MNIQKRSFIALLPRWVVWSEQNIKTDEYLVDHFSVWWTEFEVKKPHPVLKQYNAKNFALILR